jgi:hypothetical protein
LTRAKASNLAYTLTCGDGGVALDRLRVVTAKGTSDYTIDGAGPVLMGARL